MSEEIPILILLLSVNYHELALAEGREMEEVQHTATTCGVRLCHNNPYSGLAKPFAKNPLGALL